MLGTQRITLALTLFSPSENQPFFVEPLIYFVAMAANASLNPLTTFSIPPFRTEKLSENLSVRVTSAVRAQTITKLWPMSSAAWRRWAETCSFGTFRVSSFQHQVFCIFQGLIPSFIDGINLLFPAAFMDLLLHCISFSVSIPSFVAVLPALVTFPYNVLSLMLFLTPIFCFESCYLVFVDVIVLCWLLIRISLLFSILLFLKFLLLCYGLVHKDIKLVSKSIVNFCTTTLIDCLPFAIYWNIPPYSIQIEMESHLASYLIGVTDEEAEIKEPIWVYYFQRTLTWNLTHTSQCSPSLPTNVLIGKSNQSLEYSQRTLESYDNSQRTHYYPFLICHQTLPLSSQLPNSLRTEWKHLKSILLDFSPWKKKS